ncbi:ABC transporter permease [Arabiibacter massiliensis]|uniref:ABC transporter permease n=1 Tax=Arabiibacter massiliensis TaxID=1870985 RepID=UPI00155B2AEC|nr:ABC transporter permease [Arabiibacter massiliensis]
MMEKLGAKRLLLPFVALVVAGFVMAMTVYPMVTAEPKNLPLGVLSLDEGAETPQGAVNVGDQIVEKMTGAAGEGAVLWTRYESQAELDAALEAHELYAAVVVPEGYTAAQLQAKMAAAQQAETPAPAPLSVIVDAGKNPMAAASVESTIKSQIADAGLEAQVERHNAGDLGGGSLNMAVQFTVLPAFIITLVCSVSLFAVTRAKKGATRAQRLRMAGVQLAAIAVLSCCVGFGVAGIVGGIAGLAIPVVETGLFLWLASFCLMALFVGCLDVAVGLGAFVIVAVFACGLATGNLPYEFLPAFWQEWLYPWVPQRFIAEGARSLFYLGGSVWNTSAGPLAVYGIVGLAVLALAPLLPGCKKPATDEQPAIQ